MSFTPLDSKLKPTRRDAIIMGLLKSSFWIVATENEILSIIFNFKKLRKKDK